ncbi:hypothetical protein ACIQBJ_07480 [Kitasatospora sp. NPDC088391]|uniref:hypothetical protein n=1 Tax=Kitasatospora sp. NPDC088391 TaxID=3364074 RepID=UPI00381ECA0E
MTATSYCVPCRRHLNGAFSCPGCGAPAGVGPVPEAPRASPAAVLPAVVADRPRRDRAGSRRRAGRPGRRVAVLTAAGLVLGGAGVVAATVDGGAGSPPPAPVGSPDRPAPSSAPASVAPSDAPTPSATTAKPSRSPGAKPSGAAPATTAPSTAVPVAAPATTPAPSTPAATAPGGPPGSKPSPSPTCTPFLFWCR